MGKLLSVAFLLACTGAVQAEDRIFLQCRADPGGPEQAPLIVIDKAKRTISFYPLKDALPLVDDEQSYTGRMIVPPANAVEISVNRYTLRYRYINSLVPSDKLITGQCAVAERKI